MGSSRFAVRLVVSAASGALVALLIVFSGFRSHSGQKASPSLPLAVHQTQPHKLLLLPSRRTYEVLPAVAPRPGRIIDQCFLSKFEIITPASERESAVVVSALKKNWADVLQLLDNGAPVDSANEVGITPLMVAASQGDANIVGALLRRQANANARDLAGRTALCYAIQSRQLAAVQSLLPMTSDFETRAADGRDLLMMAFETGDTRMLDALLERLPDGLEWSSGARMALQAALQADRREQVCLLLSKHRGPPTREGGTAPLIAYAIASGDASLFQTLLACGADPNTIIPKTAEKEFIALVKSKYLRTYIQEETGIDLLMLAAGLGRTDYVHDLIAAGADRNRTTPREHWRALYFAAWSGNWRSVQLLLGSGPTPEQLRVEVSLARQNMAVIKDGITILTTHCSTGREGFSTPVGEYVITDKDRDHRSTIYKVPMPYFMRLSCRDFGMHAGVVATYPASHGCIRLPSEVARRLFVEIPVGTVVMIN